MVGRSYSIGELAQEFGVTPRAIRFYESKGLIRPQRRGARRIYFAGDRLRLSSILKGKRVGFNLDDIGEMLALYDLHDGAPSAGAEQQLSRALSLFDARIGDLERQRSDLESSIEELRRGRAQVEIAMAKRGHKIPQGSNGRRMIGYGLMPAED